jgi:hypothetical protein
LLQQQTDLATIQHTGRQRVIICNEARAQNPYRATSLIEIRFRQIGNTRPDDMTVGRTVPRGEHGLGTDHQLRHHDGFLHQDGAFSAIDRSAQEPWRWARAVPMLRATMPRIGPKAHSRLMPDAAQSRLTAVIFDPVISRFLVRHNSLALQAGIAEHAHKRLDSFDAVQTEHSEASHQMRSATVTIVHDTVLLSARGVLTNQS